MPGRYLEQLDIEHRCMPRRYGLLALAKDVDGVAHILRGVENRLWNAPTEVAHQLG